MEDMIEAKATILEKGELNITSNDIKRYDSDCDSLMKEIGDVIVKDIAVPSNKAYFFVFFPLGKENIRNLMEKQGVYQLVGSLFTIVYDKDLNFKFYKKGESIIPTSMRYMILSIL